MTPRELVGFVKQAGEEFASLIEDVPSEAFHAPDPEGWSLDRVSGHVAELCTYWAAEASDLASRPGGALGRPLDDPQRTSGIDRFLDATPEQAARAVRLSVAQAVVILRGIPPHRWGSKGVHARYGEMTAADVAIQLLLEHLEEHVDQARALAGEAGAG